MLLLVNVTHFASIKELINLFQFSTSGILDGQLFKHRFISSLFSASTRHHTDACRSLQEPTTDERGRIIF